jgi:hypothetical protein
VPSGTILCYRGPDQATLGVNASSRNFPNLESFGFLLTDRYSWRTVDDALVAGSRASDRRSLSQRESLTNGRNACANRKILAVKSNLDRADAHRILSIPNPLKKHRRTS